MTGGEVRVVDLGPGRHPVWLVVEPSYGAWAAFRDIRNSREFFGSFPSADEAMRRLVGSCEEDAVAIDRRTRRDV